MTEQVPGAVGQEILLEPGQTPMLTNAGDTVYIGRIVELKAGFDPA